MKEAEGDREARTPRGAAVPGVRAASPVADGGERAGLGALWLLLAPLACCGGPLLIAALAAAGALAWAGAGLAAAALAAAAAMALIRRRRSHRARCQPGATGWANDHEHGGS
jgi:hypothetical protein